MASPFPLHAVDAIVPCSKVVADDVGKFGTVVWNAKLGARVWVEDLAVAALPAGNAYICMYYEICI
jgi:hypothetical protein